MLGNRILSMTLQNIKNVEYGRFEFPEYSAYEKGLFFEPRCGVLGFYGQNGSGKTTVVATLDILKALAMGWILADVREGKKHVQKDLLYLLSLGAKNGSVTIECLINSVEGYKQYKVVYEFCLERGEDNQVTISKEVFRAYPRHDKGTPFKYPFAPIIIDYSKPYISALYDGVRHEEGTKVDLPSPDSPDYKTFVQLSAHKELCHSTERSLLFSDILRTYLRKHRSRNVKEVGAVLDEFYKQLVFNLFVFSSRHAATVYFEKSLVCGIYRDEKSGKEIHGMFFTADEPFVIDEDNLGGYQQMILNVNSFIGTFVPGFALGIECLSTETDAEGKKKVKIEIYRIIGNARLPLSQESDGIRRMISLCAAFTYVYGEPSAWVVVDEMDTGIFENLWGQIIELLANEGKGQILFTAHNLAPLERISTYSLVFTTQNPKNRYIRFKNVKKTNNLRDLYLRALRLGGQEEQLAYNVDGQDLGISLWNSFENTKNWKKPNA